jgi:hypothetical protein
VVIRAELKKMMMMMMMMMMMGGGDIKTLGR